MPGQPPVLIGREYWSPQQTQKDGYLYQAALQRLLTQPKSPWRRYPWNLQLDLGR